MKYFMLLRQIDGDEKRIQSEGRFKQVREMRSAAYMAVAVEKQTNHVTYAQLSRSDPPDFFLLRNAPGQGDEVRPMITYVEHTSYRDRVPHVQLESQLRSTKFRHSSAFTYDYILLIDMDSIDDEDVAAVEALMIEKQIAYKVWLMSVNRDGADETVHIRALNSPFTRIDASLKADTGKFPDEPEAIYLKLSRNDTRPNSQGQPYSQEYPWPDPIEGLKY